VYAARARAGLGVPAGAAEPDIRDRYPFQSPIQRRIRAIATPPKSPSSPARHKPVARKKVAKPALPDAGNTLGTPRKKTIAAGPKVAAPRTRKPKTQPSMLDKLQSVIVGSLEDDKAENVVTLDLAGKAMFCDRMVIASGLVDRQIAAMAQHLREKLHQAGLKRVQIEGAGGSDWVLIDAGDIVVHLFKPEARTMYALEKMWGDDLDEAV
jgi:ribosome silencing factor RsfS/YbeB/iojap